ncbi:zinc finger CCCH domain-containing protein 13 isoform X2 [Nematostella vectensis]|uniref:zinc finger CCCH domain-containing protein 13 isoform X2 n=1 Tax=Nematostella vectensis TaxID=45351 RepID=UPI0020770B44|nr:zinc finger CCCH domain-containing protein 13 isoform X2 [Nematostella vectensis]
MSGTRLTRRVTVEGGKKVAETSSSAVPSQSQSSSRRSVFERLGPGAVDRSQPREAYQPERCRNWLRDGRCLYGNNCKFLHGPFTDPKPRTKTVRSVVQGTARSEEEDERPHHSRTKSLDSVDFEEDDAKDLQHKQRRPRVEEEPGDSPQKKATKVKKKHTPKHGTDDDEEPASRKRKKKSHKKRDSTPEAAPSSPGVLAARTAMQWEDQGELDYQKQLALEKRRQDLQRQLALMDEEDAAVDDGWEGKEVRKEARRQEEEHRKVTVVHSKLHPEQSVTPPASTSPSAPPPAATEKKKKKREGDGKVKVKKDGSPRRKDEEKRKVTTDEEDRGAEKIKSKDSISEEERVAERPPKKTPQKRRPMEEPDYRSLPVQDDVRSRSVEGEPARKERSSPERRMGKQRRDVTLDWEEPLPRHVDERPRRPHDHHADPYDSHAIAEEYPRGRDQGREEGRRDMTPESHRRGPPSRHDRAPPPASKRIPTGEGHRAEEARSAERGRRREGERGSSGPRTPSPDRGRQRTPEGAAGRYYDEGPDDKLEYPVKGGRGRGPRTPPGDPTYEHTRGPPPERHARPPRTPPSDHDDRPFSPIEQEANRSNRFSERDGEFSRRQREPEAMARDNSYPDRARSDGDYDRRGSRDNETRGAKPVEDYPRSRPRDESFERGRPRDNRDDDYSRGRENKEEDYPKGRHRDERPEEFPRRGRDEPEFVRPRGRDDGGKPSREPPRDQHRRPYDDPGGLERESRGERDARRDDPREDRRPDMIEGRGRDRPERPDRTGERGREPRYSTPQGPDYHRRPSPSPPGPPRNAPYGPPRGRSPPPSHRFDDRRRPDEGFRGAPGRDNMGGRGRGGRGRGGYNAPYDNRGKPGDVRRRSPPSGPSRGFQDRDRGPPGRGRDAPPGRGQGYTNRGRGQPGNRYRDQGAPWDRRPERDNSRDRGTRPYDDRDRRPRDASPPPGPGYREQRSWDGRRGSPPPPMAPPPRSASPNHRPPYEDDLEGRARVGERERPPDAWEYPEDDPQGRGVRKRPAKASSRSLSPVEHKKHRSRSLEIPGLPSEPLHPPNEATLPPTLRTTPQKSPAPGKEGKKVKKKKEGKKSGRSPREGVVTEEGADVDMGLGGEEVKTKKPKKEKKLKEKGAKKKGKKAAAAAAAAVTETAVEEEPVKEEPEAVVEPEGVLEGALAAPEGEEVGLKPGKKRKHADGDPLKGKDGEKKKKKKKKHTQEVVVQPWADEDEERNAAEAARAVSEENQSKSELSPEPTKVEEEKPADEMFSDWSDDDSPVGDDSWPDNPPESPEDQLPTSSVKARTPSPAPPEEPKGPSFEDVYDPISDDEFDAMYTQSDEEEDVEEVNKAPDVEEVDWSSLAAANTGLQKEKEPHAHLQRFTPGHVFTRIGISPSLAGQRLTNLVKEACAKVTSESELFIPTEGPKCLGAYVAAAASRRRYRKGLMSDLGPCRRALCARRDLAIRKQLGRTSNKLGKVAVLAGSSSAPVDRELFQMSVALYRKDSTESSETALPPRVGQAVLSPA